MNPASGHEYFIANENSTAAKTPAATQPSDSRALRRFRSKFLLCATLSNLSTVEVVQQKPRVYQPGPSERIRFCCNPSYNGHFLLHEEKSSGAYYLVSKRMAVNLGELVTRHCIWLCQDVYGVEFLLPLPLSCVQSKMPAWPASYEMEMSQWGWVRLEIHPMHAKLVSVTEGVPSESPTWSSRPFHKIVLAAFENRIIDTPRHPVVRKLLGLP